MKNNTLWIVLAVILLALLIWWFTQGNGDTANNTTNNTTTESTSDSTSAGTSTSSKTSIKNLLTAGRPVTCTFDSKAEGKGTVYVSGTKTRVDYTAAGTSGHMINDGTNIYFWTDGMTQGFKMAATADSTSEISSTAPDMSTEQDYSCRTWAPTASSFNTPTNVTFTALPGAQ